MPLFGKNQDSAQEQPAPPPAPGGIPTEAVIQMKQQGYSIDQIIQALTDQGYGSSQIFDAISQADIGKPASPIGETVPEPPPPPAPENIPPPEMPGQPVYEPVPEQPAEPMAAYPEPQPTVTKEEIEEIAESIIEEKWNDLMKSLEKVVEWKDSAGVKINKIEQAIKDLRKQFEELHSGVLERISEYDKGIRNVGVNVKAMEEVFKKLLPQFTENVSKLSRITKKVK